MKSLIGFILGATRRTPGSRSDRRLARDTSLVANLLRDVRYSGRSLRRAPVFCVTVIATLSLAVGANTTVFSLLYGVVLQPLPFSDADRLVQVFNVFDGVPSEDSRAGWSQYVDFNAQADLFEGFVLARTDVRVRDDASVTSSAVTADFFAFFGVEPILGRFFTPEETLPEPEHVVVLTQTVWETEFDADPGVIGREVRFLNETPYIITGVAPRRMEALAPAVRYFTPFPVTATARNPANRYAAPTSLWTRLRPGVTKAQAYQQLVAVERRAIAEYGSPGHLAFFDQNPRPFEIGRPSPLASGLGLLQAGALCLVLIGAINVLNLLVVRLLRRAPELALRQALGAGRATIARMMLVESGWLAGAGLAGGCAVAWAALAVTNRYLVALYPNVSPVSVAGPVLAAAAGLALVLCLALGLVPITLLYASRRLGLSASSRTSSQGRGARKLSTALVVLQIAATVSLVVGAGLLLRSFGNVNAVRPGFDASQVVVGRLNYAAFYSDAQERFNLRRRVLQAMRELPGVEHASFDLEPGSIVGGLINRDGVTIRGGSSNGEAEPRTLIKHVDGEYFATMGIDIVEGRAFDYGTTECPEGAGAATSFVVDEVFAKRYLNNRTVVGASLVRGGTPPRTDAGWSRVVGVSARANLEGLEQRDGLPVVYICAGEYSDPRVNILVRTARSAAGTIDQMRAAVRDIDPRLYLHDATSLDAPFDTLQLGRKVAAMLVGVFAALALLLSAIGIYGVLSYDVQQRRREIAIRSAVGARRGQVLALVLRQAFGRTMVGLLLGLAGAAYLTRFITGWLFDVGRLDAPTYVFGSVTLLVVALVASAVPARRALGVDPTEALRQE